jgi:hypothetical protein
MILFLLFTLNAYAEEPSFNVQLEKKSPYTLKFTPPPEHHFNLQAPTNVSLVRGGAAPVSGELKKDEHSVAATFAENRLQKDCTVKASLYVCNDANTYCKPVKRDFECDTLKTK